MTTTPALTLEDVTLTLGDGDEVVTALDAVSLTVHPGEFVAIDAALDRLIEGEVCLILIDQVEEALAHIARRVAKG